MKTKKPITVILLFVALAACFAMPQRQAEANLGETFYGVRISRDSNYVSYNNVAFPFNFKMFGLDSMWDPNDPTKIKIEHDGVYEIGLNMTALGELYRCNPSVLPISAERVIYEIVKNWCGDENVCKHLHSDILFDRFEIQNTYGANGNSSSTIVALEQGDYLQLITTGKYNGPNGTPALCIESNWDGKGILSPGMWAIYLGALP